MPTPLLAQLTQIQQLNNVLKSQQVQQVEQQTLNVYSSNLGYLKAGSILLTIFFLISCVFFMVKTGWLALRIDRVEDVLLKSDMPRKRSIKVWNKIKTHFFAGDDNSLKLALIEADNVLDEALRLAGFRGDNLGERLKQIEESQLANIQEVWEAHKLRNRLVHETDFKLNRNIAEKALTIYEETLKDLGLLD
ncbi:MAG: hypothetical protein KGJ89_00590 [Patescibacteria group bacterium]|nr:hypothetical protein [Patescibacteria group bacterium]MDE2015012.1 hypothetical protein [Patescibacteria group bacterium]MDE2226440.1 hypothetical protein [Patescibacteria group bacterium]